MSSPEVFDSSTPSQVADSRQLTEGFATQSRRYESFSLQDFKVKFKNKRDMGLINWEEDVAIRVQGSVRNSCYRFVSYQNLYNRYFMSNEPEYYQFYVASDVPVKLFFRVLCTQAQHRIRSLKVMFQWYGQKNGALAELDNWNVLFRQQGESYEYFGVTKTHFFQNRDAMFDWLEYVPNFDQFRSSINNLFLDNCSPCLGGRVRGEEPWHLLDIEALKQDTLSPVHSTFVTLEQFQQLNLHFCDDIDTYRRRDMSDSRPHALYPPDANDDLEAYLAAGDKNFITHAAKRIISDVVNKHNPHARIVGHEQVAEGSFGGQYEKCIEVRFALANLCAHGLEQDEDDTGLVIYSWREKAFRVCCKCKTPAVFSTDASKAHLYEWICKTFFQLKELGLDRPDMPILKEEFERRCLLPEQFQFKTNDFVYHPPRQGTDMYWNLEIWNILSTSMLWTGTEAERMARLTSYLNLFMALCCKGTIAVRSEWGVDRWSKNDLKMYADQLHYIPYEESKKKTPKQKPFFDAWFQSASRRGFSEIRNMSFEMWEVKDTISENTLVSTKVPITKLNIQPMRLFNAMDALSQYQSLKKSDDRTNKRFASLLARVWTTYKHFLTFNEEGIVASQARDVVQRWFLMKAFNPGKKLQVALYLAGDFGTGKSWFFELLVKILGLRLILVTKDSGDFFKRRFNAEVFVDGMTLVVFDDNCVDVRDKQAAANERNFTTSMVVSGARKNKDEFGQASNVTDFAFTTNPEGAGQLFATRPGEFDRRKFALQMANEKEQDAFLKSSKYRAFSRCEEHEADDEKWSVDGKQAVNCAFCFLSSERYWAIAQQMIKGPTFEENGKLFAPFVGMLYDHYLAMEAEYNASPIVNSLPVTKLMIDQQKLSAGPIAKWFDECLERGYLIGCFGGKEKDWPAGESAYFPQEFNPNQDGEPFWIEECEWATLRKQYQIDTGDHQSKVDYFKREIAKIAQTRGGPAELDQEEKPCIHHIMRAEGDDKIWRPTRGTVSKKVVLIEQWRPVVKENARARVGNFLALFEEATRGLEDTLKGRDDGAAQDSLRRSRSHAQLEKSSSSNSQINEQSPSVPQTIIIRDEDENPMPARETVVQTVRRIQREDAALGHTLAIRQAKRNRRYENENDFEDFSDGGSSPKSHRLLDNEAHEASDREVEREEAEALATMDEQSDGIDLERISE